jgi:hypothetical protein
MLPLRYSGENWDVMRINWYLTALLLGVNCLPAVACALACRGPAINEQFVLRTIKMGASTAIAIGVNSKPARP